MKTNYSNLGGYAGNTDGVSFSYNNSKTIEIVDQTLSSHQKQNSMSIGQRTAKFVGFLAFCVLMLQGVAFGQTTLIDPATVGGFNVGTTFASNGWSQSSSANNPWVVGTAVAAAPIAGNSAYISDNGGTANNYTPANNATNFFWRDVTVPSGQSVITLTFNVRVQGEATWDILQVFTAPTTITPVGVNTHPGSGVAVIPPGITGATVIGSPAMNAAVQTVTYSLPGSLAGTTFRLIFSWKNETGGTQPPAAVDNISLVSAAPSNFTASTLGGLWSSPATWVGGIVPPAGNNVSIPAGSIVTVDQAVTTNNLTISGTMQWNATSNVLTVGGNLLINSGGNFRPFTAVATPVGQTINVAGNFTNNGSANLATASTALNFNGAGSTLDGTGSFLTDGTVDGVVRQLSFQNTGANVINTTQSLKLTNGLTHTGGSLNTNNKLKIDNTAQVYGQALNNQVSNLVVTAMGTTYSVSPVVFGAAVTQWTNITGVLNTLYVSGGNVYRCTAAANIGPAAPTHTSGIAQNLLWIGTTGTLGTPYPMNAASVIGTQYFHGNNLYTATVANLAAANTAAAAPVHTTGIVNGFLYVGTVAKATVNYDATTQTVRSLNLTQAGSGYSGAPSIAFSVGVAAGTGSGATATAVYFQQIAGPASFLTQKSGGAATISGTIGINSDQGASTLSGNLVQSSSGVGAISTTGGGVNYTVAPLVGFTGPTALNLVTNSGSGYTVAPTVVLTGGTLVNGVALTAANFTVTVSQGKVISVYLNTIGTACYSVPPVLSLSAGSATIAWPTNCWPTATATIGANRQILNFTVTNPGFGYVAAPTVNIGITTATAAGGTFTTVATQPTCRIALYNLTSNLFIPATTAVVQGEDAAIPTNRKLSNLSLAGNGLGMTVTSNLILFGTAPLTLTASSSSTGNVLNLGTNDLIFTWNGFAGVTPTFGATNAYVRNGGILLTLRGGSTGALNFPFSGSATTAGFSCVTGTGSLATGSDILTIEVTELGAPTNTAAGTGAGVGARAFRVNTTTVTGTNFTAAGTAGTTPTASLRFNSQDALNASLTQNMVYVAQSPALAGGWNVMSAALGGATVIPATGTLTTATAAPGPITLANNSFYAWSVILPTCPTLTGPTNALTNVSLSPTLTWTAGLNTSTYDVYFSDLQSDVDNLVVGARVSLDQIGTSFSPPSALNTLTTYYWRVVPKNAAGFSNNTCTTYSFITQGSSPTISPTVSSLAFGNYCVNGTGSDQNFTLGATFLTNTTVDVVGSTVFQLSTSPTGPFTSSLSLSAPGGTLNNTIIYVRYLPTSLSASSENIVISGGGATDANVAVTGTGVSSFVFTGATATATASPATVCEGSATSLSVVVSNNQNRTIGAGATTSATYPNPFYTNWGHSKNQYLILASELTAAGITAGNINSMAINITVGTTALTDFSVQMGNSSATNLAAFDNATPLTSVFSAPTLTPIIGSNVLTFSTPFNWNGTSNLLIQTCFGNNNTATVTSTATVDNTAFVSCAHWNVTATTNGATTCGQTASTITYSIRPRFIFNANTAPASTAFSWSNGASVVGTTNPLSNTPVANTTYTATATVSGCPVLSNGAAVTFVPTPLAPTFSNNTVQCGSNIPTVTFAGANGQSLPNLNWFNAPTAGTNVNPSVYTGAINVTHYNNDFSTGLTSGSITASIAGTAAINAGAMRITPPVTLSQLGGFSVPGTNIDVDGHRISFTLTTSAAAAADGMSFNFSDDATTTSAIAEQGVGSKLSVCFDTYDATGPTSEGIRVKYGNVELGFSSNVAWRGSTVPVIIDISNAGLVTVTVNGVALISNIALPAGYVAANKAAWTFRWVARSGGIAGEHTIDNVDIKYASLTPAATFPTAIATTTTYYVSESVGACISPRTAVTVTVNTPDALTAAASVPSITCLGGSTNLSVSQTGTTNTYSPLTWSLASYAGSGMSGPTTTTLGTPITITPTVAGTYSFLITGIDGACTATSTVNVVVNNPTAGISIIASSSLSSVCSGNGVTLSSITFNSTLAAPVYTAPPAVTNPTSDEDLGNITITQGAVTILNNTTSQNSLSGTIGTATGTVGSYSNFTSFGPYALAAGSVYNFSISSNQAAGGTFTNAMAIYIDYNRDGDYADAGEQVYTSPSLVAGAHTRTGSFTVPAGATMGLTRMRLICIESSLITSPTQTAGYGEYEEYTISIGAPSTSLTWFNGSTSIGTTNPLTTAALTSPGVFTAQGTFSGCSVTSNVVNVAVTPPLSAPIGTNSTQCGPAIPTAFMSTGNSQSLPVYNWYSVASGGTALNTMNTFYTNDFSTSLSYGSVTGVLYDNGNLNTATGFVRLTANTASTNGALSIPAIGVNANAYQFGFDLTTTAAGADGMSFSFGNDVDPNTILTAGQTAEYGTGSKLRVTFDIFGAAGADGAGIRVIYNGVELAYNSTNLAWIGTAFAPMLIDINSAGQISVSAGGVTVISNVQLPPAYLSANKATWAFAYKARTGGTSGLHRIDNVLIKYLPIPNDTYPNTVSSTTTFYVSETVGACESPRTPVTVTVLSNIPPAAPTVTSTPTINVGGTSTFTAAGVAGGTISWYSSALGGAVLGTGATFTSPTQCTPNTNITYYASDDDGTCVSTTRGSSITAVRPLITTDPANALICNTGGNVVLSANVSGGSSIAWSPGSTLTSTTALVTTATPTTTTQYAFSANVAGCSAQSGTVNVGVIPGASFTPTATPAALCEGGTSVLASNLASAGFAVSTIANSPSTAPGSAVSLANGGATPVVPLTSGGNDDGGWGAIPLGFTYNFFGANYTTVNVSTNGFIQFGAYNANGGFTAPYGLGDYTYTTPFPTTLEPMNIVAGGACDLTVTNGTVRYWTEGLAPTRVFVISYNVNGLGSGNNTFQIKLFETTGIVEVHVTSNTAQTASNKAIGVNNFDGTIGNTAYNNIANVTNTAYRFVPGAAYTFQWSVGGSDVSGATSTSYTTPALNTPGAVVYTCAATNPLTQCASEQPVTITVNPKPTAPISGGDVTACSNITPQTLSVNAPAGCTIDWYAAATGGTVLAGGTGTVTFSATTAGTYFAEARNTTTSCTSPTRTAVVYTQTLAPAAPTVTTPIAFCENSIATALTATGTGLNTLNWYTVATGGTPSSSAPTPATTTATTLSYYVSQVDAGNSCESNRALITVQIDATPAAPVTSAAGPYCENATAIALSATALGSNTLNWYTVPTGGTASGTAITPATTPAATTLYYVSQTAAYTLPTLTCESARASISVVVNPNITASVDNSATTTSLCTGGNIDFTATATNGGTTPSYQWQVNGVNVGTNSPTYTLTPQLFSDNGGNSAYSSSWSNASNGGTGFGAWNISYGANTGTYIGDPAADGNSNAGIGTNAFGMYATGSAYLNALRTINGGMQVGDTLSFYWIFNWDANGGAKGFSLRNGGTEVFFVNNSGASSTIISTAGTVNTAYGTTPMFVKLVRTSSTEYAFSMTSRSGGATYTTTITNSTSIDGINFYIGNQNQASGNRNMYVNNLVMKKYYQVLVNMTPSVQTCLSSSSATPSNTIVLGYAPSTPAVSIVAGATTTICPGTSLSFSIASSANLGSTPTYQWQVNGVDVVGQTGATFASTTLVNGDVVSLIASSSISGGCLTSVTATSNTVSVTVQAPTTFTAQPADAAACLGATQVFSGTATGTGTISYQWFKSNVLITGNPTAITNSLTLAGLVSGSAADYYVRATGTCGSANSDTITLTLNPNTVITSQPVVASLCAGLDTSFVVGATGFGTLTYQWRKNGTAISGETNDTLVLSNVLAATAGSYSVLVTGGCNSLASNNVALTVNPLVNFVTQPAATPTVCAGATSNLSASVTGAGTLSYQWQLNGVNVPLATSTSLSISNTQAANQGVYTLIATSSLCGADTSSISTLTVNPITAITTPPTDLTLCNGSDALFNVVTAGIGTINYQWRYNGTNIPGATNDTLLLDNITNVANGGTYNVVVTGGTCSVGAINSTTVSLNIQSPTNAVSGSQSATCVVRGGDWIHFYTNDGKLLVSIKGTTPTADFGSVTATSYVLADAQITTSCADPVNEYYKTAVLGRSWYINPTNNLPAIVRLPISNTEVSALISKSAVTTFNENDNVFSLADINLSKYNGLNENGSWQDNCNPADSTSYATSNLYISQAASGALSTTNGFIETIAGTSYVEFSVPGFSEFWLMNSEFATPLPVKLTSFAASCEENEVSVKWTTATEQNSQNFIVERSRDLAIWEFVSNVEAAGNSSTSLEYAVSDLDPISGVSYYRLKQVDLNGAEKIYGPISVSCSEKENEMIVFPNPTKGNFTVEISSIENYSDAQIQITDLTGKVINARSTNILEGKNQFTFEGLDLQLGTYIINLNTGNGKINPVRVVVN